MAIQRETTGPGIRETKTEEVSKKLQEVNQRLDAMLSELKSMKVIVQGMATSCGAKPSIGASRRYISHEPIFAHFGCLLRHSALASRN
jgi:hypothetical protein